MSKNLDISLLLDFYGDMLNEKQREIIEDYYNADLSLAEIAEDKGISRQGVRDNIKRSEAQLLELENRLNLYKRFNMVQNKLCQIQEYAEKIEITTHNDDIMNLAKEIGLIANELIE